MRQWLGLLRPQSTLQWVWVAFAGAVVLLMSSFLLIGDDAYGRLRSSGTDQSLPIIEVVERTDAGEPSAVRIQWNSIRADADGTLVLQQAQGSVQGDHVAVRIYEDIVWTQTRYRTTGPGRSILFGVGVPLLAGLAPIVALNLWDRRRPTSELTWRRDESASP